MEVWINGRPRLRKILASRVKDAVGTELPRPEEVDPRYRAVVIGYGPVGRTLVRLLRENDILPTVIEMNLEGMPSWRRA